MVRQVLKLLIIINNIISNIISNIINNYLHNHGVQKKNGNQNNLIFHVFFQGNYCPLSLDVS